MTTMTIEIERDANTNNIARAIRQLKGVKKVKVLPDKTFERIPGLPYTDEERIASVRKSMEEFRAGAFISIEELENRHPRI